jgi:cyclohexyl-isocyanide hydratase
MRLILKVAFIVFNDLTLLDFAGVYDTITRLKTLKFKNDLSWDICAMTDMVRDKLGFKIIPDKVRNDLGKYDAIIVPGGMGTRSLQNDSEFIEWIKTAQNIQYKISICTGGLLLGAAGFLKGKRATTNYLEYDTLRQYCSEVVEERIVEDGDVITSGAVTSSIDLGLYLCEKWASKEAKEKIREVIDYPYSK